MFGDLPRNTLLQLKDGAFFLTKGQICESHGMKKVCCYMGHRYRDDRMLDYDPFTCYHNMIESIIKKP
jgi:hypothetical protein